MIAFSSWLDRHRSARARAVVLRVGLAAVALPVLAPAWADAAIPGHIRRHDNVVVQRGGGGNHAAMQLRIRAFGRNFDLELEPSPLLSAGAQTVTIANNTVRRRASAPVLYRGRLADDPDATVRVAVTNASLVGSVTTRGETYYFEPLRRYERGASADRTMVYRASDIDASALEPLGCGAEATAGSFPGVVGGQAAGLAATPRLHGSSLGMVELTLVADHAFFAEHGSDSAAYMQVIIDQVATFYPVDLGVVLSVVQTVIHETPDSAILSASTDSLTLIQSLAERRQSQAGTYGAGDVTHLFTGRNLDGSIVGVAYVGAVCDSYYGASLVQDFSTDLHLSTLLSGHELGHTLGAFHDGQDGSPCESADWGYVMWPSIQNGLAEQFSTCSQSLIHPVIDAASCVTTAIPPGCGDGDLDVGEECDDGNNAASDCCRADCVLDSPGVLCSGDGNTCTSDTCDGNGACLHANLTGSCDDSDACTTDGQCSAGSCVSTGQLRPMDSARLKAAFRAGDDDDSSTLRTAMAATLASPPTASGATVRFLAAGGAVLHESVAAAEQWLDRKGAGRTFVFESGDIPLPGAAGLSSMTVKFNSSRSTAKVKAKWEGIDLPFLAGLGSVGVQVLVGDAASGDCASAVTMTCKVSATRLSCD